VDREKYIELAYGGNAGDVSSQGWPFVFDRRPSGDEMGKYWHYDPDEAKAQLEAAGQSNLEFALTVANNAPTANMESLANMYREVSVNMRLQVVDYNEYLPHVTGRQYQESAITNAIGIHPAANFFCCL